MARPGSPLGCAECGKDYSLTAFASLFSTHCIKCESVVTKTCKGCQQDLPRNRFPLNNTMADGRQSKCKTCKAKGVRTVKHCPCGAKLDNASGNRRYCDPCRPPSSGRRNPGAVRSDRAMTALARLLRMKW